jgi:hypothetical protein
LCTKLNLTKIQRDYSTQKGGARKEGI